MRTALITTTVNIPTVLELYRQHGPDVMFFVAGDRKSPDEEIVKLLERLGPHCYMGIDAQHGLYKSSKLWGENTIQRRAFALMAAVNWGADVIVSVDTDDFPTTPDHFERIANIIEQPYNGIELKTESGWVDPGSLIEPPTSHRGMPVRLDRFYVHPAVERQVGVVASTVLGSCDLAAIDRLTGTPKRHSVSELARSGVVINPRRSWTLFNSEAVAFRADLAPAAMVLPHVGRYDDLFASMVCQRVMQERDWHVHLGPPVVWHEREDRNILKDLVNELYGMEKILDFAKWLDAIQLKGDSVLEDVRTIWGAVGVLPDKTHEAALAWCDDYEAVT